MSSSVLASYSFTKSLVAHPDSGSLVVRSVFLLLKINKGSDILFLLVSGIIVM